MRRHTKHLLVWLLALFALAGLVIAGRALSMRSAQAKLSTTTQTASNATPSRPPSFNIHQYSTSVASSLWVVVNKKRPLNPKTYVPTDLVVPNVPLRLAATSPEMHMRPETAEALQQLFAAATQAGFALNVQSGYRSYNTQLNLYAYYVAQQGQAAADQSSARAGYSEHQTGLAVDIGTVSGKCEVDQCFGDLPEGQWVAAHAYEYGFIVRYPKGMESITGYEYEPWHIRYVGTALSKQMHTTSTATLEKFFGLPPAPSY